MSYKDMTFCARHDCPRATCERHLCHVPPNEYVSISDLRGEWGFCPLVTDLVHVETVKKVYTPRIRRIRAELGLDQGYKYAEDGRLVRVEEVDTE